MPKKDDIYVGLIQFVKDKTLEKGFITHIEAMTFLNSNYPEIATITRSRIFTEMTIPIQAGPQNSHRITLEAYFHLLEYVELKEARKSSKNAMIIAIFAILISIFTSIGSMGLQAYQINTASQVIINDDQFNQIIHASTEPQQVILDQSQIEKLAASSKPPQSMKLNGDQFNQIIHASTEPQRVILDQNQIEKLNAGDKLPKNVLLNAAQFNQIIKLMKNSRAEALD